MSAEDFQIPRQTIEELSDNQEVFDYELSEEQKQVLGRAALNLII